MAKRILRIALEVLSLAALLGTVLFLIIYWKQIPPQVPTRYDAAGRIEDWSAKATLVLLPVGGAVLYVLLSLSKTIRYRSFGKEVRIPAPPLLFPFMKLTLSAGFSYMTVCGALVRPLGAWFFPVFLGLTLIPLIVCTLVLIRS